MIASSFCGQITTLASSLFDVPYTLVLSKARDRVAVRPRQAVMAVLREVKGYSFPRIGRQFGRDHTTVMHAIATAQRLCLSDVEFATRYQTLLAESERLNDSVMSRLREVRMVDPNKFKPRLSTSEVCEIAGFGPQTLLKRVREGRMPQPVDRAHHFIFDRDEVLKALKMVGEHQEAGQW